MYESILVATPPATFGPGPDIQISVRQMLLGGAVSAFFVTLLVNALLLTLLPEYTERLTGAVFEEIVGPFLYGFTALSLLVGLVVLLGISTSELLLVTLPVVAAVVVWFCGSSLVLLGVADRLIDHDGWSVALLASATINAGLTLGGVGGLASFALGALGFGTVLSDWFG